VIKSDLLFSSSVTSPFWSCKLSYIILNDVFNIPNNTEKIYQNAIFNTSSEIIIAPRTARAFFRNLLPFCDYGYTHNLIDEYFRCPPEIPIPLHDLHFVFNGYALKVPLPSLFGPDAEFKIHFWRHGEDHWNLGQAFMKNFHIAFDNEKDVITFSGNVTNVSYYTTDDDFVAKEHVILFLVISFVVLAIIIGIWIYFVKKEKKNPEFTYRNIIDAPCASRIVNEKQRRRNNA